MNRTGKARGQATEGTWSCPRCGRRFRRQHQRHACGTGDRNEVLRDRPDAIGRLYTAVEFFVRSLGPVEIVARERYVLFRTNRIFADLVIMTDAVRAAIHLGRTVVDPIFFKTGVDRNHVTHVAKLRTTSDLAAVERYLREAYAFSLSRPKR